MMTSRKAKALSERTALALGTSALLALSLPPAIAQEPAPDAFETPPVMQAKELTGDIALSSDLFTVAPDVPTDGFMAQYSIGSEFGAFSASGPGMLETRLNEIRALAALEAIASDDQFTQAAQGKAKDKLGGLEALIERPGETIRGIPEGVGRFFDRTGRSIRTGVQKIEAARKAGADAGASSALPGAAPAGEAGPRPPLTELIAKAGGEAALNVLGFDEQRRALARELGVDPYSTNPRLTARLDEVTWAAFGGGLGVNVITSLIPGGMILSTSSTMTDWVWNAKPGDIRVQVVETLRGIGAPEAEIDHLLRHRAYTLSMQQVIARALNAMEGVDGLRDVLTLALTASSEGQARFVTQSIEMMKNYHLNVEPLERLDIQGTILGQSVAGSTVLMAPVDVLSWSPMMGRYSARFASQDIPVTLHVSGLITQRAASELRDQGWVISAQSPLGPQEYPIR